MNPTPQNIKEDINRMLDNGTLTLGEPCVPHDVGKTKITNGNVEKETIVVYGRKFPLKVIRQNLLKSHENLMYLQTDDEIDLLSYTEVQEYFSKLHIETDDRDIQQSKEKMKVYQRSRNFAFWHDHSTILEAGYIMMTVHVLFDPGVFKQFNDQNRIEEPQLYMLCLSSSSSADQLATIPDRIDCFLDLQEPIISEKGIYVHDTMRMFVGDHPAQSFERGCQIGGM